MRSQALQLQELNDNPGILPYRIGQAIVSSDNWIIAKTLDLRPILEDLKDNYYKCTQLDKLVDNFDDDFIEYFIDVRIQANYLRNITLIKLEQISPSTRIKRGLINPLGSIIKIITGNLDNDDAIRYETLISNIRTEQNKQKNKMTLITEMMLSISNSTFQLNDNINEINLGIQELRHNLSEIIKKDALNHIETQIINTYNLLIHNYQTIYVKLNEIETSFALSRLGILHQSIINSNILLNTLLNISKVEKLAYKPTLDNLVKLEQTIAIKAYIKGNYITYLLEIPIIKDDTYIYYKLIPLPVLSHGSTIIIVPKYPYLIAKGLKTRLLDHPCKEIDKASFLCYEREVLQFINDPCVTELMTYNENATSCVPVPVITEDILLQPLQTNTWTLFIRKEELLTKTCFNEVNRQKIKGTYLLTLDDPCEVKIGNITLKKT